jgi:Ca-activated chloride channel family protein
MRGKTLRLLAAFLSALGTVVIWADLGGGASAAQKGEESVKGNQAIHVQVEMVSLPVVVTDRMGNHVRDLKKEDFQVFEDGVPQEIGGFAAVEEPISVALTLDTSGSTEFQLGRIRQEAVRFVNLLRQDDSIALISFADEVRLLEPFNIYHKKSTDSLRSLKPGGLSAVYEAVWLSLEQVLKLEYGRKALVLFSDGIDNRSETVTEQETLDLARKTEATIYCIYFNTSKDHYKRISTMFAPSLDSSRFASAAQWPPRIPIPKGKNPEYTAAQEYLLKLARYSGGILVDASRIGNLGAAFSRIAQELRSQYSIGYYPKNTKHDGAFRKVDVRVTRLDLTARTKEGYYSLK